MSDRRRDRPLIAMAVGVLVTITIFFIGYSYKTSDNMDRSAVSTESPRVLAIRLWISLRPPAATFPLPRGNNRFFVSSQNAGRPRIPGPNCYQLLSRLRGLSDRVP